jgi:hypothetical protein
VREQHPEFFFQHFMQAIKPTIDALSPHKASCWWMPYAALTGFHRQTIARWRAMKRLPEHAIQTVQSLLALHEIASLDHADATLEDAKRIARDRLVHSLLTVPQARPAEAPVCRKPRAGHGPATGPRRRPPSPNTRPYRWPSDEEVWAAAQLHADGLSPRQIGRGMDRDVKTVRSMLGRVLGEQDIQQLTARCRNKQKEPV